MYSFSWSTYIGCIRLRLFCWRMQVTVQEPPRNLSNCFVWLRFSKMYETQRAGKTTNQNYSKKCLVLNGYLLLECISRRCNLPKGLAKEHPTMDVVSLEYKIGAPDAYVLQNSTDCRIKPNGTSPVTPKRFKNNNKFPWWGWMDNSYDGYKIDMAIYSSKRGG